MKLLKMELENFRQYMGKQTIEFASDDKNITIIFGENGKGKTGIFRALMFCLYGSTHIQQDNVNEDVHLVSFKLLEESMKPVEMVVKVTFEHLGKKCELSRSLKGIKRGNRIEERFHYVKLVITDEFGNYGTEIYDTQLDVKNKMNSILDEEIKDFFLFDGEKIDTLAKTNDTVKKEVRTAIFKLLQINSLEEAKSMIDSLFKSENSNIISKAKNTNLNNKEKEMNDQKEFIDQKKVHLEQLYIEQEENTKIINHYELQLSQNEDIHKIQDEIKRKQKELEGKTSHLNDLKLNALDLMKKDIPFLLFNKTFPNVLNYLEQLTVDQKSLVPADVLDASISSGVCACCNNDLVVHQENLMYVQSLRDNYRRSELVTMSSSIRNLIIDKQNSYEESEQSIVKLLRRMDELDKGRKEVIQSINVLKNEIGSKANSELHLEQIKQALENQKKKLLSNKVTIEHTKQAIEQAEKKLGQLEQEFEDMVRNNESLRFDNQVLDILKSLRVDISNITSDFSTNMRKQLRDLTTSIFKRLIDTKDINLISEININEKFELEIIGYDGIEITQDISQGQRQIVALAFITALAQIAAGDNLIINFPLFMDSPFNRLSATNRDKLIENIPTLTSQWILLLTDTELTISEERVFKENKKLGKFYKIIQNDVLDATIVPINLNENLATRGL